MRRILQFLFPVCAGLVALFGPKVNAEPPLMPIAVCDNAHCVLTVKDYQDLRAFHMKLLEAAREIQEQNGQLTEINNELRSRLMSAAFCQGSKS